jgi:hypothetical protein
VPVNVKKRMACLFSNVQKGWLHTRILNKKSKRKKRKNWELAHNR